MTTTQTKTDRILGRAAKFPFKIESGTWQMTSLGKIGQEQHLKESIQDIIFTILGERFFRRDYGSLVIDSIFENINEANALSIENSIYDALDEYEFKADIQSLTITPDPEKSRYIVFLKYVFANELKEGNLIFPISAEDFRQAENA